MMKRGVVRGVASAIACAALLLAGCSQESADWKQASVANTPEAYQLFLQQHPHAAEAAQAQARLQQLTEQRDWQIASAADTRDAYQQFVAKHPDSQWAQEARIRIENFAQAAANGGVGAAAPTASTPPVAAAAPQARAATTPAPPVAARRGAASHAQALRVATRRTHHAALARSGGAHRSSRLVQLGAFRTRARAESEWRQLAARFSTLRTLRPHYVAVHARSGRLYRLQVRLSSARAASGLCATLRRHDRPCVRVNA
ncbi:MAG TPA: SPOR domain-containing protein [Steroidobacteraceae bacterium]|nr:SPOR domain-containing protein [Steroidobacteraceae bacterium]